MWYVIATKYNANPDYIARTGYPYVLSSVYYSGNSKEKAMKEYQSLIEESEREAEYVYHHDAEFLDRWDAIYRRGRFFYQIEMFKQ